MVTLPKWLEYVESQIGFVLPTSQHSWLENAIYQTASKHKIGVADLWKQVKSDSDIRQDLLDAVLILESRFFRHPPSIAFITQLAVQKKLECQQPKSDSKVPFPSLVKSTSYQSNLNNYLDGFRVWSVGCSEGQEVWSLAMSLTVAGVTNFHILGSDVSTKAISTARQATYENGSKREIPIECQNFVQPLLTDEQLKNKKQLQTYWQVDKSLHKQVFFVLSNAFVAASYDIPSAHLLTKQDVIICQNMLIYFRKFDQRDILARMVDRCAIGGHVVLAPGEAVFWKHPQMQRVDNDHINAWKKIK